MQIILPKKLENKLKEEIEKTQLTQDELILKALSEFFKEPLDPETKVDIHLALSEKYLNNAEELLKEADYVQASEKAWGAASQMLKALAAKRGIELRSHGELHKFVADLTKRTGDIELNTLWGSATSLHQNFYENWLPEETVNHWIENVKKFVKKLKNLVEQKNETLS